MKRIILSVVAFTAVTMTSCKKSETNPVPAAKSNMSFAKSVSAYKGAPSFSANFCDSGIIQTLYAGQNINIGTVTINEDFSSGIVYVTYRSTGNWFFNNLHLYVGSQDACAIPVNKSGSPVPGQFPFNQSLNQYAQTYTVAIYGLQGNKFCVAAHADVAQIVSGQTIQTQSAWANGIRISGGNWATFFNAEIPFCTPVNDGGNDI